MTEEKARRAANVIVAAAGITLAIAVVTQPRLRRLVWRLAPVVLQPWRPRPLLVAALAALASSGGASRGTPSSGMPSSGGRRASP
jgi:hypothetical protein